LAPFISETSERFKDWADILVGYRKYIAQYQDQIIMYPLDGDLLSLFYRKDVLEHFGLTVPRTWDEYSYVLQQTHGKTFENQTLYGSCVGRSCSNAYWTWLMLSQMTQTQGSWSGHAFDTRDMKPLTGAAFEQALQWLEDHVKYAPDDGEFL
jgi:multiple sugar transport system substrate-binding protein